MTPKDTGTADVIALGTDSADDTDLDDLAWRGHAQALARQLRDAGDITDPVWETAVAAVPRHRLVPRAYRQQPDGSWLTFDTRADLAQVYSPITLVTQVLGNIGVSSSTKPDLMLRMLELLECTAGHRVLEIGTGTGYNAALLCERLGEDAVFSVDVDPQLVDAARERLAAIGYRPALAATNGAGGWPEHGPYDRIIATCSVSGIPWTWYEQLAVNGLLLADLKLSAGAGNLVLLRRHPDRLEGRFTSRWAGFMSLRNRPDDGAAAASSARVDQTPTSRDSVAPAQPWTSHRPVWMLASRELPTGTVHGYSLDSDSRAPTATTLTAPDGSWCQVSLTPDDPNGPRRVHEAGATPLWCHVEAVYQDWLSWDEPGWERFGLTVTARGHTVWLDQPANPV